MAGYVICEGFRFFNPVMGFNTLRLVAFTDITTTLIFIASGGELD
jgi:hypothetical protein